VDEAEEIEDENGKLVFVFVKTESILNIGIRIDGDVVDGKVLDEEEDTMSND